MSSEDYNFDPNDEITYYYGDLTREQVKEILLDSSSGTFLIRDSQKDFDQKVLCVKEASKLINNYKIIKNQQTQKFYLYGKEDCLFESISQILEFYSTHYLNQSPLVKPAFHHKKCLALYDFLDSDDPHEDLYFNEGDILEVLEYTQGNEWWRAMNTKNGKEGLIPVPLVRRLKPNEWPLMRNGIEVQTTTTKTNNSSNVDEKETEEKPIEFEEQKSLNQLTPGVDGPPFEAKVIEDYTPSPYEHSHLNLRKGQLIKVIEMNSDGKWLGLLSDGKQGLFPFNRVQLLS